MSRWQRFLHKGFFWSGCLRSRTKRVEGGGGGLELLLIKIIALPATSANVVCFAQWSMTHAFFTYQETEGWGAQYTLSPQLHFLINLNLPLNLPNGIAWGSNSGQPNICALVKLEIQKETKPRGQRGISSSKSSDDPPCVGLVGIMASADGFLGILP